MADVIAQALENSPGVPEAAKPMDARDEEWQILGINYWRCGRQGGFVTAGIPPQMKDYIVHRLSGSETANRQTCKEDDKSCW